MNELSTEHSDPTVPDRPRDAGGVWGSYVAYLQDLEREVERHRKANLLRAVERPDLADFEMSLADVVERAMEAG